jgi:hypothetical protein
MRLFEKIFMITGTLAFVMGIIESIGIRNNTLFFNSLAGLCLIGLHITTVGWKK